jgi:hypothetical protein
MLFNNHAFTQFLRRCCSFILRAATLSSLALASVSCGEAKQITPSSPGKLQKLVADYYAAKANSSLALKTDLNTLHPDDRCRHHEPELPCVDAVCKHLPSYSCDDMSEIRAVTQVCSSQENGLCIEAACNRLPSYSCDDLSEIKQVAQACEGQYNNRCLDAVCSHMSSYSCDDISEIKQVGQACAGFNDASCVNSVCSRLSQHECDDLSELKQVIKTCKGQ